MKCPKCGEEMEYEEIKFPAIVWYCVCGYEQDGEVDMGDLIEQAKHRFEN